VTVIRAEGLDRMQRVQGEFAVTAADVQAAMKHAADQARIERALRRPAITAVPFMTKKPKLDGEANTDWPLGSSLLIRETRDQQGRVRDSWSVSLAYDADNLYVAARAKEDSPLLNAVPAAEWRRVFQFGDGVDVHLGLDAAADPLRAEPVPGDLRLVLTATAKGPLAVLYRYRVPVIAGGLPVTFTSPVGAVTIDQVREFKPLNMQVLRQERAWSLEAAIPWKDLGAAPEQGTALRGDVGVLISDPAGLTTVSRHYWANRSNVVMSDLPSEARVNPSLWGELRFSEGDIMEGVIDDEPDDAALPGFE
jgi:hypothetical protein